MACDYTALSAYLDGELGETERRRVEAHINKCSDCAQELQSLERVRAMVTACAIPSGMHGRLMLQLEREEHPKHGISLRWVWAAASAIVVICAAYWLMGPSGDPEMPAVAPMIATKPAPERQELAQTETPKVTPPAPAVAEAPMEETRLALQLQGTIKGTVPQAVILRTDTGKSATYGVGQEVLPGLRLTEVRDKEVMLADAGGKERLLNMAENPEPEVQSLAGLWSGTLHQGGGAPKEPITVKLTDVAGQLTMTLEEELDKVMRGYRSGQRIVLASEEQEAAISVEATVDPTFTKITGRATEVFDGGGNEYAVELTRVPVETARELDEQAKLDAAREAEIEAMIKPLKQYAEGHEDKFPGDLNQLVPDLVPDLSAYENRPDRAVKYIPGGMRSPGAGLDFATFRPDLEPRERLIALEQQMQALWGSEIPLRIIVEVAYTNKDGSTDTYYVTNICEHFKRTSGARTSASLEESIAVDRATSQNNLKQLMVVTKMFAGEEKGLTPPGWVSMFPEYLVDANTCTAPWDDVGTNSYEILFPASTEEELEAFTAQLAPNTPNFPTDPEDPAYRAKLQSCTPFIIEKHPDPRNPVGRNVAFLDGHVGFVKNEAWNTVVAPFTR
ncbi:MAG: zf-HC2 domain-containing protein [FCB group bacterium]|jgi:prepilin-type processing-associated H-X9-DG protein|nr:zf-HC2 domain-containing protein [FCB group bacterium]